MEKNKLAQSLFRTAVSEFTPNINRYAALENLIELGSQIGGPVLDTLLGEFQRRMNTHFIMLTQEAIMRVNGSPFTLMNIYLDQSWEPAWAIEVILRRLPKEVEMFHPTYRALLVGMLTSALKNTVGYTSELTVSLAKHYVLALIILAEDDPASQSAYCLKALSSQIRSIDKNLYRFMLKHAQGLI